MRLIPSANENSLMVRLSYISTMLQHLGGKHPRETFTAQQENVGGIFSCAKLTRSLGERKGLEQGVNSLCLDPVNTQWRTRGGGAQERAGLEQLTHYACFQPSVSAILQRALMYISSCTERVFTGSSEKPALHCVALYPILLAGIGTSRLLHPARRQT